MSDKDRRKKDGQRQDKQNKAMHEAVQERKEDTAEKQADTQGEPRTIRPTDS